jgi:predicted DCC family thiol-disulfide oxidoreductase YuxK
VRRLVTGPIGYARELGRAIASGWSRFFFTPADPTPIGVVRVALGLLLVWNMCVYGLDLRAFFGRAGWTDPVVLREVMALERPSAWSFWLWVPDSLLRLVWVCSLVLLALFTVGLWSRVTAVLAWVIVVSTVRRVPNTLYGFDQIASTLALYLAASGSSGQAVSLDRFLERLRTARAELAHWPRDGRWPMPSGVPKPSVSANVALRLIQLHVALIYGMAGLAKLQGMGWWDGSAAWGVVAAGEFRRFNLTWLAADSYLLNFLTHAGLLFELSFPILVWVAPLRPLVLACAVLTHLGIDLALGLTEFGLAMMTANVAFVSGSWLRSLVTGRSQPAGRVLYDGQCPRCRWTMALVGAADPDQVAQPIDLNTVDPASISRSLSRSACLRAMHLVRSNGRVYVGFDAFRALASWLPLAWPMALVFWIPGLAWLGRRAYNTQASRRSREAPCSDQSCGLHPQITKSRAPVPTTSGSDLHETKRRERP